LIRPGRFLIGDALQLRQKTARARNELIYCHDESLQPGVLLRHLASKRVVSQAVV
jgi:hypothetical protein